MSPPEDSRVVRPPSPRPPEIVVSLLQAIPKESALQEIEVLLRELAESVRGSDGLTAIRWREAAIEALKDRLSAPARWVDAAFQTSEAASEDAPPGSISFELPEPWPHPVRGEKLLDAVEASFHRFLVMDSSAVSAAALWALHTFVFDAFTISPRLAICSPTMRCGKTLLLEVLEQLVAKPQMAANLTAPVLFRIAEQHQPTLLVDEGDTFLAGKDELRGALNSGYRSSGSTLRVGGDDHQLFAYRTFTPVAIAMIGKLPETLGDRAIPISMRRRRKDETRDAFRRDQIEAFLPVRRQAQRWCDDHRDTLAASDPAVPSDLHDREADNWRPLLAIADEVGGAWPEKARSAARDLAGAQSAIAEDGAEILLLRDLRDLFDDDGDDVLPTDGILSALECLEERPWAEWRQGRPLSAVQLARLLRPFGPRPKQVRIGSKTCKGYEREAFEDAFARYLPPHDPKHPKQVNNDGTFRVSSTRNTAPDVSGRESTKSPMNSGVVSGVSGQIGESPGEPAEREVFEL